MEQILLSLLVGVAFAVFAFAVIYSSRRLQAELPDEDREYLDSLPPLLRAIWPLVRLVDYYLCHRLPDRVVAGPAETLRLAGLLYLLSPHQFVALCLISAVACTAATGWGAYALDHFDGRGLLVGAALGLF